MRSVKVRGMVRGATGYAYHTRSFVRGFLALGTDVELEEYHLWGPQLPEHLQDPLYDRLSAPVDSTVQVQFAMPHRAVVTPGLATAVYTMFEASRIPPGWVPRSEQWALTVVPSRSSVDAWTASGVVAERLRVCPLGVRQGLDRPDVRPLPITDRTGRAVADYRHRFLNVAEVCTRKNHVGIMEAWLRATTPADDAVLVLKVNGFRPGAWAGGSPTWRRPRPRCGPSSTAGPRPRRRPRAGSSPTTPGRRSPAACSRSCPNWSRPGSVGI